MEYALAYVSDGLFAAGFIALGCLLCAAWERVFPTPAEGE